MASSALDTVKGLAKQATLDYITTARRIAKDTLYRTLEDFSRTDTSRKRLVVIGLTGSGKSTLLNVMAGWRFVQSKETDYEFIWKKKGEGDDAASPLFDSAASSESVTKVAAFANVDFRGDPDRPLTVVDTPGHDDSAAADIDTQEARDALGAIAADLHNKLKALGTVHALLVVHNDVASNRLNPATYQLLKMVDEKFSKAGHSVWEHVVIGYSKCNAHETSWRSGLEGKRAALQKSIRDKVPGCSVDVPVVPLGGGEIEPPPPSQDEADGLERLWQFVEAAPPLDTSKLQPFEGADVKWQKMIDAKDEAEAIAKAAIIYTIVLAKLIAISLALFWRHMMLPQWLSLLLLNIPGLYDEVAIVSLVVWWIGPHDVGYSCKHAYKQWVLPKVQPYIEAYLGAPKAKAE